MQSKEKEQDTKTKDCAKGADRKGTPAQPKRESLGEAPNSSQQPPSQPPEPEQEASEGKEAEAAAAASTEAEKPTEEKPEDPKPEEG